VEEIMKALRVAICLACSHCLLANTQLKGMPLYLTPSLPPDFMADRLDVTYVSASNHFVAQGELRNYTGGSVSLDHIGTYFGGFVVV
jgi:hypothetical protein